MQYREVSQCLLGTQVAQVVQREVRQRLALAVKPNKHN